MVAVRQTLQVQCIGLRGHGEHGACLLMQALTSSARRNVKVCSSVAMVAARLIFARLWPTQLRGPSAKGM